MDTERRCASSSEHPHHKEPPAQHDRFRSEFGRWYLQPGWRYLLPIDEVGTAQCSLWSERAPADTTFQDEKDRLDMFQQIISEALRGRLFKAPIFGSREPPTILDIGAGTGIWAIEVAEYAWPVHPHGNRRLMPCVCPVNVGQCRLLVLTFRCHSPSSAAHAPDPVNLRVAKLTAVWQNPQRPQLRGDGRGGGLVRLLAGLL